MSRLIKFIDKGTSETSILTPFFNLILSQTYIFFSHKKYTIFHLVFTIVFYYISVISFFIKSFLLVV